MSKTIACSVCGLHHNFIDGYIPVHVRCSRCYSYLVQEVDVVDDYEMLDIYTFDEVLDELDLEVSDLPVLDSGSGHNTKCEYCSGLDDNELLLADESEDKSWSLQLKIDEYKNLSLVYISNDVVINISNDINFCPICGKELAL